MKEHDKEKISLYLDGLLTKEEEKEIEGLLSVSEECREYYDQIKMMKEDMGSLSSIPAPVGLASEIIKEIKKEGFREKEKTSFFSVVLPKLALAAGFLLVLVAVFQFFSVTTDKKKLALKKDSFQKEVRDESEDIKLAKAKVSDLELETGSRGAVEPKAFAPKKKQRMLKMEDSLSESIPAVGLDASSLTEKEESRLGLSAKPQPEIQKKSDETDLISSMEEIKEKPAEEKIIEKDLFSRKRTNQLVSAPKVDDNRQGLVTSKEDAPTDLGYAWDQDGKKAPLAKDKAEPVPCRAEGGEIVYTISVKDITAVEDIKKKLVSVHATKITDKEDQGKHQITAWIKREFLNDLETHFYNMENARFSKDAQGAFQPLGDSESMDAAEEVFVVIEYHIE